MREFGCFFWSSAVWTIRTGSEGFSPWFHEDDVAAALVKFGRQHLRIRIVIRMPYVGCIFVAHLLPALTN